MWGLAAAFGPIGWVVAGVGTAVTIYAATRDDDNETTTHSNRNEREAEARAEVKRNKKQHILGEIKQYKLKQTSRIRDSYNAEIKFTGNANIFTVKVPFLFSSVENKEILSKEGSVDTILTLENETKEILNLVKDLEGLRNESIA